MHVHNRRDGELKLGVSADMVSFLGVLISDCVFVLFLSYNLGFKGDLNDTPTHARKYNLTKIYDTVDFSVDEAFAFLSMFRFSDRFIDSSIRWFERSPSSYTASAR